MKKVSLPALPYEYGDLEPVISKEIMVLHHDKHHAAYVSGTNVALEKLDRYRRGESEDIDVRAVLRDLSFNLNGHILHSIFWPNMEPPSEDNSPGGMIGDKIVEDFGSFDAFKREFSTASKKVEGVGWGLLVYDPLSMQLLVVQVEKHNLMHIAGSNVLLALDVWEHAYYLQYRNDRGSYVDAWWRVVNWDDVEERFQRFV
jgi:Fe-Mn family superoxide dismutase